MKHGRAGQSVKVRLLASGEYRVEIVVLRRCAPNLNVDARRLNLRQAINVGSFYIIEYIGMIFWAHRTLRKPFAA